MRWRNHTSTLERVLDSVDDALYARDEGNARPPRRGSARVAKLGLLTAGGLAALTAISAGISALRRRSEEAAEGQ